MASCVRETMVVLHASLLLMLAALLPLSSALDAKWTPNGEAPAPFSTRARQEMGIDPQSFAGQTQATKPVSTGTFGLVVGSLLTMYLCNNWKIVLVLQELVMTLLKPLLVSLGAAKEQKAKQARAVQAEAARKARIARLKKSAAASSVVEDDEDDDDLEET